MATSEFPYFFEFQVLEDEFMDRFGPLPDEYFCSYRRSEFGAADIDDPASVVDSLLNNRKLSDDQKHLLRELKSASGIAQKQQLAEFLNTKLKAVGELDEGSGEPRIIQWAAAKFGNQCADRLRTRLLVEKGLTGLVTMPQILLRAIRAAFHKQRPAALCLSGGGIRSATFALGLVQALAETQLLDKFTYLSTVSGGGYLGGWLSAWMHREGGRKVSERLRRGTQSSPYDEPAPLKFLRKYSNYLTPRVGLTSGDTWAAIGGALRNIILNWTVFVPLLISLTILPMLIDAAMWWLLSSFRTPGTVLSRAGLLIVSIVAGACSLAALLFVSFWRPSLWPDLEAQTDQRGFTALLFGKKPTQTRMALRCLVPLTIAAIALTIACFSMAYSPMLQYLYILHRYPLPASLFMLVTFGVTVFLSGWLMPVILRSSTWGWELLLQVVFTVITGGIWGFLQWSAIELLRGKISPIYYCFGPAIVLVLFLIAATLFVGLMSSWTTDEDREWWARFGGYVLLLIIGWSALCFVAVAGPEILRDLQARHVNIAAGLYALLMASGISALWGGHSSKTPAISDDQPKWPLSFATVSFTTAISILGGAFLLFVLTLLAWAIQNWTGGFSDLPLAENPIFISDHVTTLIHFSLQPTQVVSVPWELSRGDFYRLGLAIAGSLIGLLAPFALGVNRLSLHALYRARLIRAYLGASNSHRQPNAFTGFDPNDNVRMHELRLVHADAIIDFELAFESLKALANQTRPLLMGLCQYLRQSREELNGAQRNKRSGAEDEYSRELKRRLASRLDVLLREVPDKLIWELSGTPVAGDYDKKRSRALELIAEKLRIQIDRQRLHRPLHIINMTLNLAGGEELAWQQRKGESFTVSALHCGSARLGYRDSLTYGARLSARGPSPGISLGTSIAISGAVFSPNMGYNSSPILTILLTLFNLRLGWWLGNPGPAGKTRFRNAEPTWSLGPFLAEALGRTNDEGKYVYLSDGGHFENLGIYEMVRRRCHFILVSDATADSSYDFSDLGNAIQKIRVDQGIEIKFDALSGIRKYSGLSSGTDDRTKAYAIGQIDYRGVDGNSAPMGTILYIKPTLSGNEPTDVLNYWSCHPDFPHESAANQWFNESRFESYRALGFHILKSIANQQWYINDNCPPARWAKGFDRLAKRAAGRWHAMPRW